MDIEERAFEAACERPVILTPIHDAAHLEGLNVLVTLQTEKGREELVLNGRVADPDRYYEAVSRVHPNVIDVDLTVRDPTTDTTPRDFLSPPKAH
jgi:hypothetical protein